MNVAPSEEKPGTAKLASSHARRTRILIYGSCVSRDSFNYFDNSRFALHSYHARHSLISAINPAPVEAIAEAGLESAFQMRMLRNDATSALIASLRSQKAPPDGVLWDLIDERLGVMKLPHNSGYLTVSNELLTSRVSLPGARHIPFGSDEHFRLWSSALDQFWRLLTAIRLAERTVLLSTAWATTTANGDPTPTSHGMQAHYANDAYQRYYTAAERLPQLRVLRMTAEEAISAADHQWGVAPFHFTPTYYRAVASRFLDTIE